VRGTRSSLTSAIFAWIAFAVFSQLLQVGLYATGRSSQSANASVSTTLAIVVDFISLGLSVYIVLMLLAENDYFFAVFATVFFIGVPFFAISQRTEQPTQSASHVPQAAHVAELRHEAAEQAAKTLARFYEVVFVDKANTGREVFTGQSVCSGNQILTPAAESQLARVFATPNPGPFSCELAVAQGAHHDAFGNPPFNPGSCLPVCNGRKMVGRVSMSDNRESAIYQADNKTSFELELGPPDRLRTRSWLINRFIGGAFSPR
jgi:hypothetical protein